ncbi:hypothetical protein HY003_00180 [Candidatus Saccharibacteria bacterium]|nr:hypothetical protein [Candidatus Saccharibacteria bacterium]MBI3337708.1 hypothetical protein [Candidatus Saccharibacteria bacterium]
MDIRNQDTRPNNQANLTTQAASSNATRGYKKSKVAVGIRLAFVALLFSATILVVALVLYVAIGGPKNEKEYVDKTKVQAVFLNGGQVYFGRIVNMSDKYINLSNIYYLSVSQQVQPDEKKTNNQQQNITLVPLGCELHRPQDNMLINRDQVIFWENMKDDSSEKTVPGAIKKDTAANPKGHTCQESGTSNTPDANKP